MTVFRQENLEEHYDTGEDLGREGLRRYCMPVLLE